MIVVVLLLLYGSTVDLFCFLGWVGCIQQLDVILVCVLALLCCVRLHSQNLDVLLNLYPNAAKVLTRRSAMGNTFDRSRIEVGKKVLSCLYPRKTEPCHAAPPSQPANLAETTSPTNEQIDLCSASSARRGEICSSSQCSSTKAEVGS